MRRFGGGSADTRAPDTAGWVRSQNLRIIDRIRNACGLGNQSEYSVGVAPAVQPVILVEPDALPPLTYSGDTLAYVVANAGFRSELTIAIASGFFPPGGLLEVYITLLPIAGQGIEIRGGVTIAGATNLNIEFGDQRIGVVGMFAVSTKNTAAASATTRQYGTATVFPGAVASPKIGPFYLSEAVGGRNLIVRPSVDNQAISCIFHWRVLFKPV